MSIEAFSNQTQDKMLRAHHASLSCKPSTAGAVPAPTAALPHYVHPPYAHSLVVPRLHLLSHGPSCRTHCSTATADDVTSTALSVQDNPWEDSHKLDDADLAEYLEPEELGLDTTDWARRLLAVGRDGKKGGHFLNEEDIYRAPLDSTNSQWGQDQDGGSSSGPKQLPAEVRCFDTARIYVRSGDGGAGCVAFRREKFVEFGGPAGGNGGPGGNVWAVADSELNSLSAFRQKIHWRASQGVRGQGSRLDGAKAADMYVPVPAGTIIRRRGADDDEPPLAELLQPGQKALLLVGGRGGRGNYAFKTSTNKAPTLAEKGELGNETWIDLELKVVADVGIIGIPNAGKSTLLSVVTAARPKIANYPFTTLVPNLGVCELDYRTTVFADIPGLLEGAHEGLGLGHQFLRHTQRCRVLLHVIDGTSKDPVGDFRAINLELELFHPELKDKPQVGAGLTERGDQHQCFFFARF